MNSLIRQILSVLYIFLFQFNKMMFNNIITLDTNYRNNFNKEYYDDLINENINLEEEVKKYSTDNYHEADVIICYTNDIRNIYNKLLKN